MKQPKLRPIHESIIRAIKRCDETMTKPDFSVLSQLIMETKIPKNHAKIIVAIDEHFTTAAKEIYQEKITAVKNSSEKQHRKTGKGRSEEEKKIKILQRQAKIVNKAHDLLQVRALF